MSPQNIQQAIASFPTSLRRLLEAELRAGNYVVKITSECSTSTDRRCIHLAKQVTTRARVSSSDFVFRDLDLPGRGAEISDLQRRFVVVEEPHDPSAEPDMDAIRASLQALELVSNADRFGPDGGLW